MWKKASADLSKYFIIFFIFFSFNRVESLSLNYNLDWGSENFITDAKIIFSNLTLQSSQQLLSGRGYEGNIMLSGGTSISLTENLPIMPLFSSFYHVSDNLWLGGMLSGYVAGENVIMLSGYMIDLLPGDISKKKVPWCLELSRRSLEGAEDFRLKTIGATLTNRIDLNHILLHCGLTTTFYDVILYNKFNVADESWPNRIKDQVNAITGTAEFSYGKFISGLKLNLSNKGSSLMFSISALLK